MELTGTTPFTLKKDRGSENPPVFHLAKLDNLQRAHVLKGIDRDVQGDYVTLYNCTKFALKGWEGAKGEAKLTEITIGGISKRTVLSDESMNALDEDWIYEIGNEVLIQNFVTEKDRKN